MIVIHSKTNSTIQKNISLSLVIPVYNEEKNISKCLIKIKTLLDSILKNYEIIVVDDGSTDNTLHVLDKFKRLYDNIIVIHYAKNQGKGFAVKTGISNSHGNAIMFLDGDTDISPNLIKQYIKQLETCDLVIASKRHKKSKVTCSFNRKFLSRGFNLLVQICTGIRLKDTQSGLKIGNGDALRVIFQCMLVKRYAFDVELLCLATLLDMKIKEMPIEIKITEKFKLKEISRMLKDVLAVGYRYRIIHWYDRKIMQIQNNTIHDYSRNLIN